MSNSLLFLVWSKFITTFFSEFLDVTRLKYFLANFHSCAFLQNLLLGWTTLNKVHSRSQTLVIQRAKRMVRNRNEGISLLVVIVESYHHLLMF